VGFGREVERAMEEEKAAAYYEELVRKGGNAARFKQGLGFGGAKGSEVGSSSIIPKSDAHASLSNFVKQASPGRAAAIQTEIRAESIRDKLKKKETIPSDEYHDSRRKHRQVVWFSAFCASAFFFLACFFVSLVCRIMQRSPCIVDAPDGV
jgi:hypothetical protein